MASPNSTFTSGAILTAAQMNSLPFGYIGSSQSLTSLSQNFTTIVDITGMSASFTGVAGRVYRADAFMLFQSTVSADAVALLIRNGSGTTMQIAVCQLANSAIAFSAYASCVFTATGATTIKISAQRQLGTGTITALGGGTFPAQLTITDIGSI